MSTLTYWSFFWMRCEEFVRFCFQNPIYFEKFGSLHIYVYQGNISAAVGPKPGTPGTHITGIKMNQKELTKTFMINSN